MSTPHHPEIPAEKPIIRTQRYEIVIDHFSDGTSTMTRRSDGFNSFELLGHMEATQLDIIAQLKGLSKSPDKIIKQVLVEAPKAEKEP